jgi:VIT1/CCC1 family predicted Fe2+/Mn2+ transporter
MDKEPKAVRRLLNPVDRISEILFGLIMALSFTCTIRIAHVDRTDVRDELFAAIGCNTSWGFVDAIMFILTELAERRRNVTILDHVRNTSDDENAKQFIADALPPVIASVLDNGQLEDIRKALLKVPKSSLSSGVTLTDIKKATGIFLLVFLSTFPVALPFILTGDVQLAFHISNLVAIILLFFSGWLLAKYSGYNRWLMSFVTTLIGIILVVITIILGG